MASTLNKEHQSRLIEMAWEDRTPFEAIQYQYGLSEAEVIKFMRRELKASSFKLWRRRMANRHSKHAKLRNPSINRGYCPTQYKQRSK